MASTISGITFKKNCNDIYIQLYQGKTISFNVIWGGDTPIDITGYDARMQFRTDYDSATIETEFNVSNGRVTVGTVDGKFQFNMTAADSAALTISTGVYDLEVINDSGEVFLAMSGKYTILPEVTK